MRNHMKRPARFAAAVVLALGLAAPAAAQDSQNHIVTFQPGVNPAGRVRVVGNAGAALRRGFSGVNAVAVRVPNAAVLAALRGDASVVSVVPDRQVFAFQGKGKPGGGGTASQVVPAGVTRVGAATALSNGEGVGVAILDTGIDLLHADLAGTVDAFSAHGDSCQDDESHGTHVAGTVAARDNSVDVVGVAPKATLFCVKVLNAQGSGEDSDLMGGLDWVLSNHATVQPRIRVINMSLGRTGTVGDNPAMHTLITQLTAAGVAVVVSAGNDAGAEIDEMIPAAYSEVLAVASTTALTGQNACSRLAGPIAADTASYFTTDGAGVAVSGPGEDAEDVNKACFVKSVGILSTKLAGGTTRMSGTSMASPHVAGIVARYFQKDPSYTVANVRQFLKDDAVRKGVAPLNSPTSSYTFDGVREGVAKAP